MSLQNLKLVYVAVSGNALQQSQKFEYLVVVITSDPRWWNMKFDRRICKLNAVVRKLYRSVLTNWALSNTAKL